MKASMFKVILGVTESDSHVVANHLIAHQLKEHGYEVINLGPCTSVSEFYREYQKQSDIMAIVIGSLNGHAYEDLEGLAELKASGSIQCPVVLGGNLSVGSEKTESLKTRFYERGVDYLPENPVDLLELLDQLSQWEKTVAITA